MTRHSGLIVGLAVALAVAGCTGEPADKATLTETECPDDVTSVVVGELTCGFLTVPEDRSDPERTVRIFVARIVPPERVHDDPMLVVGADLAGLPNYGGVAPLAQRVGREVIIMDTRGVGHSQPGLACPEVDELRTTVLATATADPATRKSYLDAATACHERLTRDGVDVSAYNLTEMAADAEDLRGALGVETWNVVAYGTASRIAFEMLRSEPGHLRSLVLDSPEVPGTDPRAIATTATRTQVDAVIASCAADQACSTAFPNARASLDAALATLAARPVTVEMDDSTRSGTIAVLYDDAMLLRTLRAMLSDGRSSGPIMAPQVIPALLAHVNAGRLAELASTLAPIVARSQPYCIGYQPKCLPQHKMSVGVLYSVLCHDIAPLHQTDVPTWTATQAPGISAYASSPLLDVCDKWLVAGKAAAEVAKPPTGNVPTLVATGAFAPYAPESVLREKLRGLTEVTFAIDPDSGHNVIVSTECLAAARNRWLDELVLAPSALACVDDQTAPFVTDLTTVLNTTTQPPPEPSTGPATSPQTALLEGDWLVSLTRGEMTAALAAGGFPDLSDRFFNVEKIPADGVRFLLKIEDGRFSGVFNDGLDESGEWYVGWSGTIAVQGDHIELRDPREGTTETLRFAVTGARLTLTPLSATPDTLKGLPTLAFDHAYLAAEPFVRVDCAKVTPPCT